MSFICRSKSEVKDKSDFVLECKNENETAYVEIKSYDNKSRHIQNLAKSPLFSSNHLIAYFRSHTFNINCLEHVLTHARITFIRNHKKKFGFIDSHHQTFERKKVQTNMLFCDITLFSQSVIILWQVHGCNQFHKNIPILLMRLYI